MKRSVLIFVILSLLLPSVYSQKKGGEANKNSGNISGQRRYTIFLNEGDEQNIQEFNRGLRDLREKSQTNRGLLDNLLGLYKSSAAGQIVSVTSSLLDMGVQAIVSATKSKKPEWEKAVKKESTFLRRLPMQMEILDFYKYPSTQGPLDPENMNLNGFGCRQVVMLNEGDQIEEKEVFYMVCKVDTSAAGKARMLNHSKFTVVLEELRFNPYLCDLPNDSLGTDVTYRIPFDWEKRKDLKFKVNADITSSWINQAMMIYNDEPLGSFEIEAAIEEDKLDEDGIFRFSKWNPGDSVKNVSVKGECFLVPRSYVGGADGMATDTWGTGQYKVEMAVYETCNINNAYYNQKEHSNEWKNEWKKIKKRRKNKSVWTQILDKVKGEYKDSQWVTIITDPITSTFVKYEKDGVTKLLNAGTSVSSASGGGSATKNPQGK